MEGYISPLKRMAVQFKNMEELDRFTKECACDDMYAYKDMLTLSGTFTELQLQLATGKYNAMVSIEKYPG